MEQGERLLGLRRRQYALLAVLLAAVVSLFLTSVVSVAAHDDELQGLYSEEADGTAMTFVQRESFGLIIELDRWAFGKVTARDVQIARALLGQRLQVRTASDATTYELTDDPYRESLAAIDDIVRNLVDGTPAERTAQRIAFDATLDAFEIRTRELSTVFQEITRDRAAGAINRRAVTEQTQAILAGVIIVLGALLAGWIATDLRSTYRQATERLRAETQRLDHARRRLEFRQRLADRAHAWSDAVAAGVDTLTIVRTALADLRELAPRAVIETETLHDGEARVVCRPSDGSNDVEPGDEDSIDIDAAIDRANEILQLARIRDRREQALDTARRFDPLTGLPNREQLQPALDSARTRARRRHPAGVVAIALVDLDRFADFNASFGHAEGDRLLVAAAGRLTAHSNGSAEVLRLSADEFAVVGAYRDAAHAREQVDLLSTGVRFVQTVGDEQVSVACTIGAVVDETLQQHPDALIQRAATALASAQAVDPRPRVRYFAWNEDEHLTDVLREESALRSALRSGEFVTHFQPILNLESGRVAGCEALVRWNRPDVGVVMPGDFLPAIARAGLTVELGWQIIDTALSTWGEQRRATGGALDAVAVSINIDAAQFADATLADYLLNAAERSGVPVDRIVVEVTEHALLGGELARTQLESLRARGVRVALDDFGTGYSSLAQASSLPLDVLKLDRSFLPDARLDPQQAAIIRDILSIAATLNLLVTAEGIETGEVAQQLRDLGVHYGQGWWFARALPVDEVGDWIIGRGAQLGSPAPRR